MTEMTNRRRGRQASDTSEAASSAEEVGGEPSSSATVVPMKQRRTYLDACRDHGVYQKDEETRDEIRQTRLTLADQAASRRMAENLEATRADAEAEIIERMRGVCRAYTDAGLAGSYFEQLCLLLFDAKVDGTDAAAIFAAAKSDDQRNHDPEEEYERRRLNAEGLNACGSTIPTQQKDHDDDHDGSQDEQTDSDSK